MAEPAAYPPESSKAATSGDSRLATRYRVMLESIDIGFCVIEVLFDAEGRPSDYRFLEANPAFARHTGLNAAVGRRMRELAPAHEDHWFQIYGRVALTGEPARFVQEARVLDHRWFEVHAYRVDAPELRRVAVLFSDVSVRVRAEGALRLLSEVSEALLDLQQESELPEKIGAKVAAHFRATQLAFAELNHDRRVVVVSSSWRAAEMPSAVGMHADDFVSEEFWQAVRAGRALAIDDIRTDARISPQARFEALQIGSLLAIPLLRDGHWRYLCVLYRGEASRWRDDEIDLLREVAGRCWSRVERLRAETALRFNDERLRLIVENALEYAIFSLDLDRQVTSWSRGAERLLHFPEEEILGQSADRVFTPEDVAAGIPAMEAEQALREGHAANERWHVCKDGTRFWGSGVMMPMRDERGRVCGLLKIMRDQTQARAAREALEQSQHDLRGALELAERARADAEAAARAKDRFIATLSHELRNPLNPVLMIAAESAADMSLPPPVRENFEVIRRNIELETRLIEDMLDMARIAQGKTSLHKTVLDLHAVVREAVDMVRAAAEQKQIELTPNLAAAEARVVGDPARLQQVFVNLLNNALKFTPQRGRITVGSGNHDREVLVSVSDNGIGLTPDELENVFRPFVQGGHTRGGSASPLYGGLGLGLAIAEDLTIRHGGRISAASEGPDRGATFTVTLPLAQVEPAPAHQQMAVERTAQGCRILLVEDHTDTRTALARMLTRRGHDVVAVGSRAEALAAVGVPFDLVISDIGLPDGEGYELLHELRRRQPGLTGIALSGFGMQTDVARSRAAGFAAHLVKPAPLPKLEEAIARLQRAARRS